MTCTRRLLDRVRYGVESAVVTQEVHSVGTRVQAAGSTAVVLKLRIGRFNSSSASRESERERITV